jgi:D-sedoheptulose 7-phosphate isomerase
VVLTSVSGESPSIINAAITAKDLGLKVVTFSGRSSSNGLKSHGDINFWVNSDAYNIVECIHMIWVTTVIDAIVGKAEYEVSS